MQDINNPQLQNQNLMNVLNIAGLELRYFANK